MAMPPELDRLAQQVASLTEEIAHWKSEARKQGRISTALDNQMLKLRHQMEAVFIQAYLVRAPLIKILTRRSTREDAEDATDALAIIDIALSLDLLPCPFCGSSATMLSYEMEGRTCYQAQCNGNNCAVEPNTGHMETRQNAVDCWNRRVSVKAEPTK